MPSGGRSVDYGTSLDKCTLTTGQVPQVQQLSCKCTGCTGSFVLSFQGFYTVNIAPTATASTLAAAINNLVPLHGVTVTLSGAGSTVCDTDGAVSSITFTHDGGNWPALQVTSLFTGGTSDISVQSGTTLLSYHCFAYSVGDFVQVSELVVQFEVPVGWCNVD
ncbi:hypothetical protein AaE_010955 [Aphanomyces astaci]|uniref:Uncharacterized protein n=1 Tax=Aphanomyces astaci TaxID=112090 RepID=A0A6A4ZWC0_APHAT|nr:hypothetical protein AaE_010955 [Aphanomyces astaci]